jgi:hypothetical protein
MTMKDIQLSRKSYTRTISKIDRKFFGSDLFQAYLTCAMEYENIVEEMFFGFARTMYNVIGATREHQILYSLCADCVYF